jgi:hypothetical protein
MFRFFPAVAAVILFAVPSFAPAAKVKVWHHHASGDYDKAQLKGAIVSSEGALRLSRQMKPLAGIDATHIWAVVEDKDGNLLVATGGDEGRVYKIGADGKPAVVYTSTDSQVLCLSAAPDGSVYAGTGPNGQVVHIDAAGKAKVIHHGDGLYVWSLALDAKGENVFAATGPKGAIYRITPEGKATVYYQTKQEHVLSVALGGDGNLYAGTDKSGLVYRIDPAGKGFVLFSAPQSEVRALVVTADAVYAGTSSPTTRRRAGGSVASSSGNSSGLTAVAKPDSPEGAASALKTGLGSSSSSPEEKESKATAAAAPSTPDRGDNSVYRIAYDGSVRELFREKTLILSLLKHGGRLLIGTGMDGQLFEVDEKTKERSEIARLDHGQVLSLCQRKDGSVVLGAGDPGKLFVMQDGFSTRGMITSDVLDAKLISKWGALRWQADTPTGTKVTVAVRSGNVAEPDDTWSDWSAEQTDAEKASIAAPLARFLQYRATLTSENAAVTPTLRELTLRYATGNQAPEVTSLEVPNLEVANLEKPKNLKFKWSATDPNEDELTYNLYVRRDGWKDWVLLEDDFEKKEFEWDTTTTPAGTYRLKVVASDRRDNSPEDSLTGERVSEPFVVAHTPPVVTVKVTSTEGDVALIEATASDELVRLTSASFAVDGKKWTSVFPADGLFDSKSETFRIRTDGLKPGTHVIVLRVKDAAGNVGTGDLVFTIPAKR